MKLPRITITVDQAGRVAFALLLLYMGFGFGFIVWAIMTRGR